MAINLRATAVAVDNAQGFSTVTVSFIVSAFCVLMFNRPFLSTMVSAHGVHSLHDYLFVGSAAVFLLAVINLLVGLAGFRFLFKFWLISLLLIGATVSYFEGAYGVILDRDMIRNVLETDPAEVAELFSWKLVLYVAVLGGLPSLLVARTRIHFGSLIREIANKSLILIVSLIIIALVSLVFYQDYASVFRNNRYVRFLIMPVGPVYASWSYLTHQLAHPPREVKVIGSDARLGASWGEGKKKVVTLLVVGETARAKNFSLNGYPRQTNPFLSEQDAIFFNNVHSCGTATAVSVPCMFALEGRRQFDPSGARYEENILDVVQRSGLGVLWRDNNSGCKGVCDRVEHEDLSHLTGDINCGNDECFDMVLMNDLKEKIDAHEKGVVIVLHQKGSHGPAYFQRVPAEFRKFSPICHTNQLQECSRSEILNAYDNSILYTDYFVSRLIGFLKQHESDYNASLIYVSDHGESLGENGIYLHGLPYVIAPEEQTHVPFLFWMSDGFASHFGVDRACLKASAGRELSHDNLFHSLLGLLDIHTGLYDEDYDMFQPCSHPPINVGNT